MRVDKLTQVTNPNARQLKVDPTAGTGNWDHTGPYGGAGNGGNWKVAYTWKVPTTVTPGKVAEVTVGMTISDVDPVQPLGFQMVVRAPDLAQAFPLHYPEKASGSMTFKVPIPAYYKDLKDLAITVSGVVSAEITYHYERQPGCRKPASAARTAQGCSKVTFAFKQGGLPNVSSGYLDMTTNGIGSGTFEEGSDRVLGFIPLDTARGRVIRTVEYLETAPGVKKEAKLVFRIVVKRGRSRGDIALRKRRVDRGISSYRSSWCRRTIRRASA